MGEQNSKKWPGELARDCLSSAVLVQSIGVDHFASQNLWSNWAIEHWKIGH